MEKSMIYDFHLSFIFMIFLLFFSSLGLEFISTKAFAAASADVAVE